MDVSIIIVNYNTEKLILDCIQSIHEKTEGISFEIIVVDNASPNEPSMLKKDNRIKYIQSETNLGFGRANNLGAKYAKGDYLHFLNPDTILINNAIYALWDYIRQHPEVGMVGSNLYQKDLSPNHSYGIKDPSILQEILWSREFTKKIYGKDFNYDEAPKKVAHIVGASMMILKNLFNQIKGFDEDFFMYCEETYLCYIVRKNGYTIMNVPQSKIIHLEGQSFTLKKSREDRTYEGRKLYFIKRYNKTYYCVCNLVMAINSTINIIYFFIVGKKEPREYWIYRLKKVLSDKYL